MWNGWFQLLNDLLAGFSLVMPHWARSERATRLTSWTSMKSFSSSGKCQCAWCNEEVKSETSANTKLVPCCVLQGLKILHGGWYLRRSEQTFLSVNWIWTQVVKKEKCQGQFPKRYQLKSKMPERRVPTSWEEQGYGCKHRVSWAAAPGRNGWSLCHSSSVMKGMNGESKARDRDTEW